MPHLQERVMDKSPGRVGLNQSMSMGSEAPITEASEGFLQATEGLLTIKGMTSARQTSSSEGPPRAVSEDASYSYTPQTHAPKPGVITPSPSGGGQQRPSYGPIVTIFGKKKLVPSPIRVKRRVSQAEEDCDEGSPEMAQPTNLRYGEDFSTPTKVVTVEESTSKHRNEPLKKRLLGQLERDMMVSPKRQRVEDSESDDSLSSKDDDSSKDSSSDGRKPVISPTNSEEGVPAMRHAGFRGHGYGTYPHQPYPPPHSSYAQPYPGSYPMYSGYPPPPPTGAHMMGRPGTHPMPPHYPPYPPHHHPVMHPHHHPSVVPHGFAMPQHRMPGNSAPDMMRNPPLSKDGLGIMANWHGANMSAGETHCTNRCLPLKEPIPSKYWGNAEKSKDVPLPDFHRLVNYPDFIVKSRGSDSSQSSDGKKNCVMCGKLRLCSASSVSSRGRAKMHSATSDDDCSGHIIPRQNKGLCTACDVTVWVVASGGLEIKWCKGCKNFRPWAAFGDKGSATKCVRCRERQREKYAAQKDELKQRKTSTVKPDDNTSQPQEESSNFGLQTLINAATV